MPDNKRANQQGTRKKERTGNTKQARSDMEDFLAAEPEIRARDLLPQGDVILYVFSTRHTPFTTMSAPKVQHSVLHADRPSRPANHLTNPQLNNASSLFTRNTNYGTGSESWVPWNISHHTAESSSAGTMVNKNITTVEPAILHSTNPSSLNLQVNATISGTKRKRDSQDMDSEQTKRVRHPKPDMILAAAVQSNNGVVEHEAKKTRASKRKKPPRKGRTSHAGHTRRDFEKTEQTGERSFETPHVDHRP